MWITFTYRICTNSSKDISSLLTFIHTHFSLDKYDVKLHLLQENQVHSSSICDCLGMSTLKNVLMFIIHFLETVKKIHWRYEVNFKRPRFEENFICEGLPSYFKIDDVFQASIVTRGYAYLKTHVS